MKLRFTHAQPQRKRSMYLGIDTHKHYSQVAVVDDDGNFQDEIRLQNEDLPALAQEYAGGKAAIEASGTYRPIYEMLDEHLDVTLVNPAKTRIIADATVKTDRVDASTETKLSKSQAQWPPVNTVERKNPRTMCYYQFSSGRS